MESKFLYFVKKQTFLTIKNTFPANLSPICFIEDTNEIWFNNHYFQAGHESITVSEMNNVVTVSLSESSFNIQPGSESISIRSQGNNIIVSCNALTKIDTDDYLEWKDNKLYHAKSGVTEGSYGPRNVIIGANTIPTLHIEVDEAGHITKIEEKETQIRDFVEQRQADNENKNRQMLLAERDESQSDTNYTRKSRVTFNNASGMMTTPKITVSGAAETNVVIVEHGNIIVKDGIIEGKVKGDIEGSATPKIHISDIPDYGGASLYTYGHVKLVDQIGENPSTSSTNTDKTNKDVEALAASPYAVKNYVDTHKMIVKALTEDSTEITLGDNWSMGEDFQSSNKKIEIRWKEYL